MSFEAYSVAIRLRLIDSVSAGLGVMATAFGAFNRHVGSSQASLLSLEKQMGRLKMMGLAGGAAAGVGLGALAMLRGPLEEAKAWAQESAKFASLGFGAKVNADAQQFALGMKTYGTSARENLTLVSDAMAVFKDLGNAEMAAPILAKMKFANEAVFGEGGKANESKFMDMLKVIELRRGLSSPKEFETQANFVQKVIAGSRGRVDASQLLQAQKTGGVGVSQLSNEAFYLGLEPIIQEFGGSRTGTAIMSIYQNLVQSRGTITAQQELYRLGLLDPHKVEFNQLGKLKKALPGAFRGSNVLENEGPLALLNQVLLPAFAHKGITKDEDIIREFGMILGNRTGSGLMARIFQQRSTIAMQANANRNAQDIDQLNATGQGTPEGKMLELSKQWKNVLRELGIAVLPAAIHAVEGLTAAVKGVLRFSRDFPTATKGLVVAFAGLAAMAAVGGTVMLVTAGFSGLGLILSRGAGMGSMLVEAAGGVSMLAKGVGVLSAATAGWALGTWLNNKFNLGEKIGDAVDAVRGVDPMGYHKGRHVVATGKGQSGIVLHTQISMDGRKVADAVSARQARSMSAPSGGANFDGSLQAAPVLLNHAH
jgi:hypothetical protein